MLEAPPVSSSQELDNILDSFPEAAGQSSIDASVAKSMLEVEGVTPSCLTKSLLPLLHIDAGVTAEEYTHPSHTMTTPSSPPALLSSVAENKARRKKIS